MSVHVLRVRADRVPEALLRLDDARSLRGVAVGQLVGPGQQHRAEVVQGARVVRPQPAQTNNRYAVHGKSRETHFTVHDKTHRENPISLHKVRIKAAYANAPFSARESSERGCANKKRALFTYPNLIYIGTDVRVRALVY